MSMKNFKDASWDRTIDLPICSTVLPPSLWFACNYYKHNVFYVESEIN